jgi:hypothetical protein
VSFFLLSLLFVLENGSAEQPVSRLVKAQRIDPAKNVRAIEQKGKHI